MNTVELQAHRARILALKQDTRKARDAAYAAGDYRTAGALTVSIDQLGLAIDQLNKQL